MIYIISLDVGDKRVGVAIGTQNPKSYAPYAIYDRAKGQAEEKIISLINSREVSEVVVGLPLSENGAINEQCTKIERFCHRLQRRCKVKIVFVDEYASSAEASEKIAELKRLSLVKRKQKKNIDDISASILLESYLDNGTILKVNEETRN
jgi:putative Holliday junction resolvase